MSTYNESKEAIAKKIREVAKNLKCPLCSNEEMVLADGFFANDLQSDFGSRSIGGVHIPTIPIICSKCGYVREFSAGVLGFIPKSETKPDTQSSDEVPNE